MTDNSLVGLPFSNYIAGQLKELRIANYDHKCAGSTFYNSIVGQLEEN